MTTLERLQTLLAEQCALPADTLGEEASLESLGVDSLGVIELMFEVEEAFGVQFDADTAASLRTVGDVAVHIDHLLVSRNEHPLNGADVVRAM